MKAAFIVIGAIVLTGCSATQPKIVHDQSQYCNTSSETVLRNGQTVDSEVVVECTDKPSLNSPKIVQSGIADHCREHYYMMNGKYKRGFVCRKLDVNGGHGGWEIVNPGHFN